MVGEYLYLYVDGLGLGQVGSIEPDTTESHLKKDYVNITIVKSRRV
jgi:hypothetical protein